MCVAVMYVENMDHKDENKPIGNQSDIFQPILWRERVNSTSCVDVNVYTTVFIFVTHKFVYV